MTSAACGDDDGGSGGGMGGGVGGGTGDAGTGGGTGDAGTGGGTGDAGTGGGTGDAGVDAGVDAGGLDCSVCDANATCEDDGSGVALCTCIPPFEGDGTTCAPPSNCGNGTIDTAEGEQCDDGNTVNLDGCSAVCKAELTYRLTDVAISTEMPTAEMGCNSSNNALGTKAIGAVAVPLLSGMIKTEIDAGNMNVLIPVLNLDDASGATDDDALQISTLAADLDPDRGAWPADAAMDPTIDWWFNFHPVGIGADGLPNDRAVGSYTAATSVLSASQPDGVLNLPLALVGSIAVLVLDQPTVRATLDGTAAVPSNQPTPLDAAFTRRPNLLATGAGLGICGNVTARSLASVAVPAALAGGGDFQCLTGLGGAALYTACAEGESPETDACNSLLDVFVSGCNALGIIAALPGGVAGQPDVDGAGGTPGTLVADATTKKVTLATDNDDGYSSYLTFTAEAAYLTGPVATTP